MKKLFIRILNKLGFIETFNFSFATNVNNQSFRIPLIKKLGLEHLHIHEPWMIQLLDKILTDRKQKAYVDIGMNLGQTLIKLKSVNSNIDYYGFEPNPVCIYYVKELARINEFKNVHLFPVGISDKTSIYELSFFTDDEADTAASIVSNFRPNKKTFRKEYIACFNIAEIVEKFSLPKIGIIKIDVEGAEQEVIQGFKEKIIADQPLIQLEILPVYDENNKDRLDRQEALENLFRQMNYVILRIHIDQQNNLVGLEEIQSIGIHSNMQWCEYLIAPADTKDEIKNMFQLL